MNSIARLTALTLFVSLTAATILAAGDRAALDTFLRAHISEEKIPGMVVGIFEGDDQWVRAYGVADIENQTPMKIDSSFRLASITKTMTAVAILQLVERGKIDLDAEVQQYVPYFPRKPWPVTIRHLLGHLAGIPHYVNRDVELHFKDHKNTREAVGVFENFDLVAEPGTKFSYSSYGYNLLGAVIEGASGLSYADYMRANVWGPLGMSATRLDDPIAVIPNRVRGYQLIDGKIANSEFVDISSRFAAGGLRTTVPDLLRFARGLMSGKLVSAANFELLSTSMQTRNGRLTGNGMGTVIHPGLGFGDTNGRFAISNSGGQAETRTFIMMFPRRNIAFATAMNAEINAGESQVRNITQSIFGEPIDFTPTAADRADRIAASAMQAVFTLGLADLEAHAKPPAGRVSSPEAARYFAAIVNEEQIEAGRHPAIGSPLIVLGRRMAEALKGRGDYSSRGAPVFFADYAALRPSDLPAHLTARLPKFARDWTEATPPAVRMLSIDRDTDLDSIARLLHAHLDGRSVVPNLAPQLSNLATQLAISGEARSAKAAALATELFPSAPVSHRAAAYAAIVAGDLPRTRTAVRRAKELGENANHMNAVAYAFAQAGRLQNGIELLSIATQEFSDVANLFDSLGELLARSGQRDRAVQAYTRALSLDPTMGSSRSALDKLTAKGTPLSEKIDAYVAPYIRHHAFSGVVLVAQGETVLVNNGYGMANVEFGAPATPATRFAIASITKMFTTAMLARLYEEKRLSPDDVLAKWVPDFPSAEKITIAALASHRSGVRDPDKLRRTIRTNLKTVEVVDVLKQQPLGSVPGETYSYTTANYAILAHVIERVTGETFAKAIHRMVYDPAVMRDSGELTTTTVVPRLATGYGPDPFSGGVAVCGPEDTSWKAGGGSSYSTAADLHSFVRAFYGKKLFAADPRTLWPLSELFGKQTVQAGGAFPGANAAFVYFIDDDVTVVVMSNNYAPIAPTIAADVAAMYFDKPFDMPVVKIATNPVPLDPRVAGVYSLEGRPNPFTIAIQDGRPYMSWNSARQSPLLPIDGHSWFVPLDWGTLRLQAGTLQEGTMTAAWSDKPLKVTRVK